MAGSRDGRPACAAPRQQTAPGPRTLARAPCTPWGRRALRAGRRRPAAHRKPFTPGRAPRQQEANRENNLCSPAGLKGSLTRGWCRRAANGAAAPARARARAAGAGWAAAGRQRMVPARLAVHSQSREGTHPNTAGPEPSRCTRRPAPPAALLMSGFLLGYRLAGAIRTHKQGVLEAPGSSMSGTMSSHTQVCLHARGALLWAAATAGRSCGAPAALRTGRSPVHAPSRAAWPASRAAPLQPAGRPCKRPGTAAPPPHAPPPAREPAEQRVRVCGGRACNPSAAEHAHVQPDAQWRGRASRRAAMGCQGLRRRGERT